MAGTTGESTSKKAIQDFLDNAKDSVKNLTTLEIKTIVGAIEFEKDGSLKPPTGDLEGIVSKVQLVSGDITTRITPDFGKNYAQLMEYHLVKENQGQEIVRKNLQVVKEIGTTLVSLLNNDDKLNEDT
ncbi:MAG: hypothetical protein NXI08_07305 [bacterium]|nr:hypothetical protein [bacterium]